MKFDFTMLLIGGGERLREMVRLYVFSSRPCPLSLSLSLSFFPLHHWIEGHMPLVPPLATPLLMTYLYGRVRMATMCVKMLSTGLFKWKCVCIVSVLSNSIVRYPKILCRMEQDLRLKSRGTFEEINMFSVRICDWTRAMSCIRS